MKVCILTPRFPMPEAGGDLLRINNIARYLKSRGHQLVLVSYTETNPDFKLAGAIYDKIYTIKRSKWDSFFYSAISLLKRTPIQCGYYYSRRFLKLFRQVIKEEAPDLYVTHLIRMVPFVDKAGVSQSTIVEMTDALSKTYILATGAKGSWLKRFMYSIEKHLIGEYELDIIRRFPKVVLVSQSDIDYLNDKLGAPFSSLAMHTNGVDLAPTVRKGYDSHKICFIGNMISLQNQDAVIYFADEVFPKILEAKPDTHFYIVGNNPPKSVQKLASRPNITVTGFVDDLQAFVSDSCLAVASIRIAAGIQNKVLVAMACQIPVVITSLIAAPIPELKDGINCFICEDADAMARRCIMLMNDKQLRSDIAANGYDMVKKHYAWSAKLNGYEDMKPNCQATK